MNERDVEKIGIIFYLFIFFLLNSMRPCDEMILTRSSMQHSLSCTLECVRFECSISKKLTNLITGLPSRFMKFIVSTLCQCRHRRHCQHYRLTVNYFFFMAVATVAAAASFPIYFYAFALLLLL